MTPRYQLVFSIVLLSFVGVVSAAPPVDSQLQLVAVDTAMLTNESEFGDPAALFDEQAESIEPGANHPETTWQLPSQHWSHHPASMYIDFGEPRKIAQLWLFDANDFGGFEVAVGQPGSWEIVEEYGCPLYNKWGSVSVDVETQYLRLTRKTPGSNIRELLIYAHSDAGWQAMQDARAEKIRQENQKQRELAEAVKEKADRPIVNLGEPFGEVILVDEIDCTTETPTHEFREHPQGVSRVETILNRPCRVIPLVEGSASYIQYRIGRRKLLESGKQYVLQVEYPEDAPRTTIVLNHGNESYRGFHTGSSVGDALHTKYVSSRPESIKTPLSGEYETWTAMFNVHDVTPDKFSYGSKEPPTIPLDEGFNVTICQFSKLNLPLSQGAAVSKIRLYEVIEPEQLVMDIHFPQDLPKRRLFWREEMADGVVGAKKPEERGVTDYVNWWAYKIDQMKFLGLNTYAKDLLEFGAVQHWDTTDGGGDDWAYMDHDHKGDWEQIVKMMGAADLDVLPYYEYTGSKGKSGLGNARRVRPLTRDDAYTHIKWVQSHGVDLTDPDAYEDFKKMLDLTVVQHQNSARFVGAWIRQRGGMPISFTDATLGRFSRDNNHGTDVTRENLIASETLLQSYYDWWFLKRRDFLVAMRDHLRENGIDDAAILYSAVGEEPGLGFNDWKPKMVTDQPDVWQKLGKMPEHQINSFDVQPVTLEQVQKDSMYLDALTAFPLTWGGWEWQHTAPPSDPRNYQETEGVMLSHAFNKLFTVVDPATFEAFRTTSGLAIMRHYCLNENMLFDEKGEALVGYFIADIEKTGPYCMQSEAIAMANGDPTWIGYLMGGNFQRGFPKYVRQFNQAFLSLPALPSTILPGASSDSSVVVRQIKTSGQGTYFSIINVSDEQKTSVTIDLPGSGDVFDAAIDTLIEAPDGQLIMDLYPYELRAIHVAE